jgi:hypothetical protein
MTTFWWPLHPLYERLSLAQWWSLKISILLLRQNWQRGFGQPFTQGHSSEVGAT